MQDPGNTYSLRPGGRQVPDAVPTIRRRGLGAKLRRLREDAGLTGDQVAARLKWSTSKVSRIENAHTAARPPEIKKLLALYGVTGAAVGELLDMAQEAARKGWWETHSPTLPPDYGPLIDMEAVADRAYSWAPFVVPGLLQTADYAREVTNGYLERIDPVPPSETRRRVAARLARQGVLTRAKPLRLTVVLDESVLYRRLGNEGLMYAQADHLLELSERDNIALHILPLKGRHPIGTGAFVLFHFDETYAVTGPDVVYLEHLTGSRYVEDEDEAYRYRRSFDRLSELAATEDASRQILKSARDGWK